MNVYVYSLSDNDKTITVGVSAPNGEICHLALKQQFPTATITFKNMIDHIINVNVPAEMVTIDGETKDVVESE